jgi:hypothetical protein
MNAPTSVFIIPCSIFDIDNSIEIVFHFYIAAYFSNYKLTVTHLTIPLFTPQ